MYVRARERDLYTLPHADIIITPNHLVINYKPNERRDERIGQQQQQQQLDKEKMMRK